MIPHPLTNIKMKPLHPDEAIHSRVLSGVNVGQQYSYTEVKEALQHYASECAVLREELYDRTDELNSLEETLNSIQKDLTTCKNLLIPPIAVHQLVIMIQKMTSPPEN